MKVHRHSQLLHTPPILIVDGVWVDVLYPGDEFKLDRAGHRRQVQQSQERVILAAMAVWPDGSYHLLHYEMALVEDTSAWLSFFENLIGRGLNPAAVKLIVSDGTSGLPAAMVKHLPMAKQQRCMTHKLRRIKDYLSYQQLPQHNEMGQKFTQPQARRQRRFQIPNDAYELYNAESREEAQQRLSVFVEKWKSLEPKAVQAFQREIDLTFTFYEFALPLHRRIRTSNLLERLERRVSAQV